VKYEIIKDKEDLYVLVINGVVVLISRDIYAITSEVCEDAKNRLISPKRTYVAAIVDIMSPENENEVANSPIKEIKNESIGNLLDL
jgi:hypothetical protein